APVVSVWAAASAPPPPEAEPAPARVPRRKDRRRPVAARSRRLPSEPPWAPRWASSPWVASASAWGAPPLPGGARAGVLAPARGVRGAGLRRPLLLRRRRRRAT